MRRLRLILLAGLFALCPAAPAGAQECAGADAALGATGEVAFGAALACVVREQRGGGTLRVDPVLSTAAERHARDMVGRGYFAHVSPAGAQLVDRLRRSRWLPRDRDWEAGEILVWATGSTATPAGLLDAWMRSPEHRRVLLDPRYDEVGVGVSGGTPLNGTDGVTSVLDFGRRA
ncbi:MAG: CAP domain-containing protein [Actinomycetota bacterium]|nr:CAP domain-containing protein [Actinomycetota bacterium]